MALADDPREHILHMFKMEMRARNDHACEIFPDGATFDGLPLTDDERVHGVYKGKFYFTTKSMIWRDKQSTHKIEWSNIIRCSTQHGCGLARSRVEMADGSIVTVPLAELSTGWDGRIGQLYHAMVERWRSPARDERFVLGLEAFFRLAKNDDAIAPNWWPAHPGLKRMRSWLEELRDFHSVVELALVVTDYDSGEPCVQEVVMVCTEVPSGPQLDILHFSSMNQSSDRTKRLLGPLPDGTVPISGVWD